MSGRIRLFAWATSISFLGTLPLGTLNLSVANYSFRNDATGAISFAVAAIAVEMGLVRLALMAIRRLERLTNFLRIFNLVSSGVLLFLAFSSLLAALEMQTFRATLPLSFLSPVASGFVLSLTNPLHLPFWMGWTTMLRSKKILDDRPGAYATFISAIGLGTGAAFCLYGFAGGYLIRLLGNRQVLLNWIVGIALLITALVQLYKIFFKASKSGILYETTQNLGYPRQIFGNSRH
jgi:hypothetical protein